MTTKTLSSLIIAGVLAGSAAAAVQVVDPSLVPVQRSLPSSASAVPATSDEALFLLRFGATLGDMEQRPAGVVRITR